MTQDPMEIALNFLNDAFEKEYQLSLFNLDAYALADDNPGSWRAMLRDPDLREKSRAIVAPLKKLPKAGVRAVKRERRHLSPEAREERRKVLRRRVILKASLYTHPEFGFVVRCLVSDTSPGSPKDFINMRWDVLVTDGVATLANTNQVLCLDCDGMSGILNQECVEKPGGWGFGGCKHGGFREPPNNDLGTLGPLQNIKRFDYSTDLYRSLYDAEV